MCIIAFAPHGVKIPDKATRAIMFENNPDGAGVMILTPSGGVVWEKGFMNEKALERGIKTLAKKHDLVACPVAIHFRIATAGGVSTACCHPFAITDDYSKQRATSGTADAVLMHNGIIAGFGRQKGISDTMQFTAEVIAPILTAYPLALKNAGIMSAIARAGGSRFLIFSRAGVTYGGDGWTKSADGVIYSNNSYLPRPKYSKHYTYNDWGDDWGEKYAPPRSKIVTTAIAIPADAGFRFTKDAQTENENSRTATSDEYAITSDGVLVCRSVPTVGDFKSSRTLYTADGKIATYSDAVAAGGEVVTVKYYD